MKNISIELIKIQQITHIFITFNNVVAKIKKIYKRKTYKPQLFLFAVC